MPGRIAPGELVLALFFALLGGLWIVAALRMPLWSGFVPQSGFMPLWYGAALAALAGAVVARSLLRRAPAAAEEPVGKPLVVVLVFAAAIGSLELFGFGPAVFLLQLVLFAAVERLPLARSALAAAATTAVLHLVFKTWLAVTLPRGPLGF